MQNVLTIAVAVIAGAAAGLCAPLLVRDRAPAAAPRVEAARPAEAPRAADDPRVSALERRMLGVQQQLEAREAREAPSAAPKVEEPPEEVRAEKQHEAEAAHEAVLALHRKEPRDERWARAQESTLGSQLAQTATALGVEVMGVDCRTQSCVARLRWADMATARGQLSTLLDDTARVGCARRIQFPETGAVPYEAEMYLECPHGP
jgi:hypothetical protein